MVEDQIEIWKEVEGFTRYKVSDTGRVWDTKHDREVAQVLTGVPQYYYVNMNNDEGKRKLVRVHRLVAIAFLENPENLGAVDHINQDKLDNSINNLRWVDRMGNSRNMKCNVYYDDVLLIDLLNNYFGEGYDRQIYRYFHKRINTYGEDIEQAYLSWKNRQIRKSK